MNGDAAVAAPGSFLSLVQKRGEVLVVLGIVVVVGILVLPVPPALLDFLLALSISFSLLVLLTALNSERALDFSSFPVLLLLLTLFRLALNVSSTRLILGEGHAGEVIQSFGQFVVGGNLIVGAVIFLILVGINFIVITKGATRVAEVAARFTLDAMPGRQMSIDGDLSAGLIDDDEARRRREEISNEADFYGAMDGAAKFVRGDAIAGLLITLINILGGILVGVVQRGMPVTQALADYTLLTVGDGLVTQIPALVVSTAAGIMVTASTRGEAVAGSLVRQLGYRAAPLWFATGFLLVLAAVPGLPTVPFLILAVAAGFAASRARRGEEERAERARGPEVGRVEGTEPDPSPVRALLQVDPVEVEIGYGLISLVEGEEGGDLLERVRMLRRQAAEELGMLIPPVRIRDDVRLDPGAYVVRVRGNEVARGSVRPGRLLALDTGKVEAPVEGEATVDPSFGMPARWIAEAQRVEAEAKGWVVVETDTVVATHLMEILKRSAAELLGRQDVKEMVDALKESYPALVDEVVPQRVSLGTLHRVLQRLLREGVPIRDLVTILETLADVAEQTKDPEPLTEHVRRALGQVISEVHSDDTGEIRAVTLGPRLEVLLMGLFSPQGPKAGAPVPDPEQITRLVGQLQETVRTHTVEGRPAPLVTPPQLRIGIRKLLEAVLPDLPVISHAELAPRISLRSIAEWEASP